MIIMHNVRLFLHFFTLIVVIARLVKHAIYHSASLILLFLDNISVIELLLNDL